MTKDQEELEKTKQLLSKLLDDRGNDALKSYKIKASNPGFSSGFLAEKDGSSYMLKKGVMRFNESSAYGEECAANKIAIYNASASLQSNLRGGNSTTDKRDLLTEYLTSTLYERILKNKAPKIGLARESDLNRQEEIYLKSKFLPNFQSIREYKNSHKGNIEIDGFEKVMAACLFMREVDYNPLNI